jgi:hypothetical protein
MRKTVVSFAAVVVAVLAFGAVTASAHGGPGKGRVSTSKLVTAAASQLSAPRSDLVAAIRKSANASIDAALEDEDITSDEAADAKDEVADNLDYAYRLSRASTVASNLGITTAALNTAFRSARKALLNAQIDAAVAAGTITADEATALKAKVAALTAGYKSGGLGAGFGGGGGCGDPAGGGGFSARGGR